MRYTPRIEFMLDQGVKKSIAVAEILSRVLPPQAVSQAPPAESGQIPIEAVEADQEDRGPSQPSHAPADEPASGEPPPEAAP
jgi:hypothetical protein